MYLVLMLIKKEVYLMANRPKFVFENIETSKNM